ncbi:MAG TPA: hypothetical protein LFV92_03290 [Rickettsia endosymbiont of Ceroptres masudai]|nr:hypothetical protein [Rickettsia endosymbiont of Ceroptres masudai]
MDTVVKPRYDRSEVGPRNNAVSQ